MQHYILLVPILHLYSCLYCVGLLAEFENAETLLISEVQMLLEHR